MNPGVYMRLISAEIDEKETKTSVSEWIQHKSMK